MPNATTNALMDIFRSRLSGAGNDVILLEFFNVANEVAREALRVTPASDPNADPDTWLPTDTWPAAFQPIQHGVLGRMYAQVFRTWANAELAKFHLGQYDQYLKLARAEASASPATVYERIISTLYAQLPMAREANIKLELYSTVDKIRKEALRLPLLGDSDTDPTTWLPADKWDDAYQALVHGTLARLHLQHGQVWSNPDLGKVNYGIFQQELERLRGDQATASRGGFIRLMDEISPRLVGAPNNLIEIELFATVREFFRDSCAWRDYISMDVLAGTAAYTLIPSENATPFHLVYVLNENDLEVAATMEQPGELLLDRAPTTDGVYQVCVALTVTDPVTGQGFPNLPDWLLSLYSDWIMDGVVGRMQSHQSKPWSSAQMAVYHLRRFRNGIAQARVAAERKQTRRQVWRYPQTFRLTHRLAQ